MTACNGRPFPPVPPPATDDALATASWALACGLWPVPITPIDDSTANSPGKQPIGKAWGAERPSESSLTTTFRRNPGAGVGLVLGAAGLVIDLDVDDPAEAEATLARLFPGGIPATMGWQANKGGHMLFRYDPRLAGLGAIVKGVRDGATGKVGGNPWYLGIELRLGAEPGESKQLQSVAPPSLKADGSPRAWNGSAEIMPLPESVFADLEKHGRERVKPPARTGTASTRHQRPTSVGATSYARAALNREVEAVAAAPNGSRNGTLNSAAFSLGQLVGANALDLGDVESALTDAARSAGLTDAETAATLASGLSAGLASPRDLAGIGARSRNGHAPHDGHARNGPTESNGADSERPEIVVSEAANDPHRLARLFLAAQCSHPDGLTLRSWRGEWVEWQGSYRPVPAGDLRARLAAVVKAEFDRLNVSETAIWERAGDDKLKPRPTAYKVTRSLIADTLQALASITLVPSATDQPVWLDGESRFPTAEVLVAPNAIIHLPTWVERRPEAAIMPPTPRFFAPSMLDYEFDLNALEPTEWLRFLGARPITSASRVRYQLWSDPEDVDCINTLQEFFGYCLLPDTRQQKILGLFGPKRSGKGTVARVLAALVGQANVANPTLSSLGTNFGLAPLLAKLVAIITDARLSGRSDVAQVVESLLSISGEDSRTVDRKHLPPITVKLPVRFVVIANELPRIADASGALAGRMLILPMSRSFFGQEDPTLTDVFLTELPGVLLWAIEGWRRLRERGYFVQPKAGKSLVETFEEMSSPIGSFVAECCKVEPDASVLVDDLFRSWKTWCERRNRKDAGDIALFGRNLRSVLPALQTKSVRGRDGWAREFRGIREREPGETPDGVASQ
jgi:putative DNA primase/helicase